MAKPRQPKDPLLAKAEAIAGRIFSGKPVNLHRWEDVKRARVRDGRITQEQLDGIKRDVADEIRRTRN